MKLNRVRVIGGAWRSRIIPFPDLKELRPTPDRVRETLFNWLGQDLTGLRCLDLFAGSGALGFEAASRGAKQVTMVERERAAHAMLEANRKALDASQVEIVRADALDFLRGARGVYDVVFLDPPFSAGLWDVLFESLPQRLATEARVYCESGEKLVPPAGWEVFKHSHAGQVNFQLLKRITHDDQSGLPRHV
ncbi:MAG TPA: 16S rRNA (guanine(966)-N(2))-methyltransferase RsmD [Burkholderiales bacterium]|nr:16S rRNA (guanine(966)-N(2))-methyltransferase RsmD [Burkholderiales bacterium]